MEGHHCHAGKEFPCKFVGNNRHYPFAVTSTHGDCYRTHSKEFAIPLRFVPMLAISIHLTLRLCTASLCLPPSPPALALHILLLLTVLLQVSHSSLLSSCLSFFSVSLHDSPLVSQSLLSLFFSQALHCL